MIGAEGLYGKRKEAAIFVLILVIFRVITCNELAHKAEILGPPHVYVDEGSNFNLTCKITNIEELPHTLYWYRDKRILNFDFLRGTVTLYKEGNDAVNSTLYMKEAQPADTGKYTCSPSNIRSASVNVYVLNGSSPQ